MRIRTLLTLALLTLAPPAFAASGNPVNVIYASGPTNPFCVQFQTSDDATTVFGFSIADPGASQEMIAINYSRQKLIESVTVNVSFLTGTLPSWANPKSNGVSSDCNLSNVTYVWKVYY
jgi:hypothetical protein